MKIFKQQERLTLEDAELFTWAQVILPAQQWTSIRVIVLVFLCKFTAINNQPKIRVESLAKIENKSFKIKNVGNVR